QCFGRCRASKSTDVRLTGRTINAARLALALLLAGPVLSASVAVAAPAAKALSGDAQRGEAVYQDKCGACHSLDANRIGPSHRGVFGRRAGSVVKFSYSPALKAS